MNSDEKWRLAQTLAALSPSPFAPRVSRGDVPDGPLKHFLEVLRQRQSLIVAETYQEHLSQDEMRELVRFFQSELGLSFMKTCSVLRERMRKALPTLQAEAASDAGIDVNDRQMGRALMSHMSKSDGA